MDTEGLPRCAPRSCATSGHRDGYGTQIGHVIERPTRRMQSALQSTALHPLIRYLRNFSLCLLFLLQVHRVRGQQADFQPIRMPGAQRHKAALVPLPVQLRPHHNYQEHRQHHNQHQRQQFRQQHQRSWSHQQHAPNNLSFPPMNRQDQRTSHFMAALNERVHLAKMHQQRQNQHQQEARQTPRQTKSLDHQSQGERPQLQRANSDRRASSASWSPNHLLHDGHLTKFSQVQADGAPIGAAQTHEKQSSQAADASGKLLICYYTTPQTAPYWPKEGREFVLPAERLNSMMAGSGVDLLDPSLQQASSVNVGSFNDRYPNYQRPEAKHMHSKYSEQPKASGERRQMVLVSPTFMPFNRTQPAPDMINQQRHRSANGPLTQLFFMSPAGSAAGHHHHHAISSRQDSSPSASTLLGTSRPATSGPNNGVLGGEQRQQRVTEAAYNLIGPASSSGSTSVGEPAEREPSQSRAAGAGRPLAKINNGESDAVNLVQMRHQHQSMDTSLAPTSRTYIGSSSSASSSPAGASLSSWTTGAARDTNNELQAASLPTSPNVMSNNYYYYYNNNNPASSPTTTVSFPTSAGSSVQSGGLTGGSVNLERAKSLQMAESELAPALQLGVSSVAPVAQQGSSLAPIAAGASVSAPGAQQTVSTVMGVSASNGPFSTHATPPQQRQHEQQLLKIQGAQMVPVGQAGEEQKATTSLVLSGPTSSMLSVAPMTATSSAVTSRPIVLKADDLLIAGRQQQQQQQQQQHEQQQHDSGSLSSSLVASPLSTVFDVFGAASQYLMRFKPSSLISPAAFSSNFNSHTGQLASLADQHHQRQSASGLLSSPNVYKTNSSSSLFSGAAASLISFPFSNGLLSGASANQLAKSTGGDSPGSRASERTANSTGSKGGFLSRLTLHSGSSQQQQQRREDICGRTIQTPERRIIGGEGAKYGEFPYQVHIKIAKHQCGGALVDRQSIVTAAHCVYHFITRAPVSKLQIVIGAYDIEDEQYQELPPQYFKVNKVKLHPNFRFSASHPDRYDIAILKLDKPVKYTDNVLPVCLPGKDLRFENMVGTVTGFGKTDPSLSNRYGTRLLQKVDVPIIENNECERWHRTRGIDLKIFPEMMCAGYEDGLKDACVGDSGGPLVIKTPVGSNGSFRWTLAGITSAGFGCAQSRQPGIYHRVSHTVDWILENLD